MTQWVAAPRSVPLGITLFAIGDVHGHAHELQAIRGFINYLVGLSDSSRSVVIYLGDYIDRGPQIGLTLKSLAYEPVDQETVKNIYLVGNHDQFLIELINCDDALDQAFLTNWFNNGGENTLRDLGVEGYGRLFQAKNFVELSRRTKLALGNEIVAFLKGLRPFHREGDYLFVHAGIDPNKALEEQDFADLLLIREPFLSAEMGWRHSFCVVHGHSISMPIVRSHRIGVDAGCYKYGALCAVQIEDGRLRFLGVSNNPNYLWNERLGRRGEWCWKEVSAILDL